MDYYDEIEEWTLGNPLDFNMNETYDFFPSISYQYIELEGGHSFFNPKCSIEDYQRYFTALKRICSESIGYWIFDAKYKKNHNFKLESSTNNTIILSILKKMAKQKEALDISQIPNIGHFHLAEHEPPEPYPKDYKPIVVHFFLGKRGQFFIIALDLYHEIHSKKKPKPI